MHQEYFCKALLVLASLRTSTHSDSYGLDGVINLNIFNFQTQPPPNLTLNVFMMVCAFFSPHKSTETALSDARSITHGRARCNQTERGLRFYQKAPKAWIIFSSSPVQLIVIMYDRLEGYFFIISTQTNSQYSQSVTAEPEMCVIVKINCTKPMNLSNKYFHSRHRKSNADLEWKFPSL